MAVEWLCRTGAALKRAKDTEGLLKHAADCGVCFHEPKSLDVIATYAPEFRFAERTDDGAEEGSIAAGD